MPLNHDRYRRLKSNRNDVVRLFKGYLLNSDEYGKLYISRGGKRKYFLEDAFVRKYFLQTEVVDNKHELLEESIELVEGLLENNKLGLKTKDTLEKIKYLLEEIL